MTPDIFPIGYHACRLPSNHQKRHFGGKRGTFSKWSISGGCGPVRRPKTSMTSNRKFPCHFSHISQFAQARSNTFFFRRSTPHRGDARGDRMACVFTSTNATVWRSGERAIMSISHLLSRLHGRTRRPIIFHPWFRRKHAATSSPHEPIRAFSCPASDTDGFFLNTAVANHMANLLLAKTFGRAARRSRQAGAWTRTQDTATSAIHRTTPRFFRATVALQSRADRLDGKRFGRR